MKPQTVHLFDLLLGRPMCLGLTVLRRAGELMRWVFGAPHRRSTPPVRKILLIKMIEQGATVLACRAIERAVEMVGRENVYFWVFADNRPILDVLGLIPNENVLALRSSNIVVFAMDVMRTLLKIRRLGIDATIDMEFFARAPVVLAFLTGARRRIGLHRYTSEGPYRGDLLTHRIQHNPYLHTAVSYYLLVEALNLDPSQCPLPKVPLPEITFAPQRFNPGEQELRKVRQAVADAVAAARPAAAEPDIAEPAANPRIPALPGPLVLLNPNAGDLLPLRRWPTERFLELGRRLLGADPALTIAITGAPSEKEDAAHVAAELRRHVAGGHGRVICMAGRTTLRELIVLYTLADLLVTNDSGPGHFASMTDLPTLVLFGPETPALFSPLGSATSVMTANLACSPCVNAMNHRFSPCNDNVCMQALSVDQVHARCSELLRQGRRPRLELTVLAGETSFGRSEAGAEATAPLFRAEEQNVSGSLS